LHLQSTLGLHGSASGDIGGAGGGGRALGRAEIARDSLYLHSLFIGFAAVGRVAIVSAVSYVVGLNSPVLLDGSNVGWQAVVLLGTLSDGEGSSREVILDAVDAAGLVTLATRQAGQAFFATAVGLALRHL